MVEAVPVDVPEDLTSAGAIALLPAQAGRGHLLVGFGREEGRPSTPRVWESADGANWADAPAPAPPGDQARITVSTAAWAGPVLALGGSTTDAAGPAAAVWLAENGRDFTTAPELPMGPAAVDGSSSGVSALTLGDGGLVAAGWVEGDVTTTFVTIRGADGAWHPAIVPDLPDFSVNGVAANGWTIVVTGSDGSVEPEQAQALVSTDAGASFQLADTTSLGGGVASLLGGVAVVPGGFVASACAPTATGDVTALARTGDGLVWTRQDIQLVGDEEALGDLSLQSAGCGEVAVLGDRVHVGVLDINGWDLAVGPDGTAIAREIPRRTGTIDDAPPFVLPTDGNGTVVVGVTAGGLTPAVLELGLIGEGLPPGGPQVTTISLTPTGGTLAAQVAMYPGVEEVGNGAFNWSGYANWFSSPDGRTFASANIPSTVDSINPTPFGEVALSTALDPADDAAPGPNKGTEVLILNPDGTWRSGGLIASGPGSDGLYDLVADGTGAVAVGSASTRDPSTNVETTTPLVRSTADGVTWGAEVVPLPEGAVGGLSSVCALPDRVVAYGWQIVDGVRSTIVAVRDPSGAWSVTPATGVPAANSLGSCTTDGTRIVIIGSGRDRSSVFVSTDGTNFQSANLSSVAFADTSFAEIVPIPGGFVAAGSRPSASRDWNGALWWSADGLAWLSVAIDGMDGFGVQSALSAALAPDGSLSVAGIDNGSPVVWNVPIAAVTAG